MVNCDYWKEIIFTSSARIPPLRSAVGAVVRNELWIASAAPETCGGTRCGSAATYGASVTRTAALP